MLGWLHGEGTLRAVVLVSLLLGGVGGQASEALLYAAIAVATLIIVGDLVRHLPAIDAGGLFLPILVAGVLVASVLWNAPGTMYGQEKVLRLATFTLLSALAMSILRNRAELLQFARVWLLAGLALSALTLASPAAATGRAAAFDANPIWVCRALVAAIIIAVWLAWRRDLPRLAALPLLAVLLAGALATGARGPLAGGAVSIIVIAVAFPRGRIPRVYVLVSTAALAVAGVSWGLIDATGRVGTFLLNPLEQVVGSDRIALWRPAFQLALDNPAGIGWGNFSPRTGSRLLWPHNLFLEVFSEGGWVAGAVLTAAVIAILVRLLRVAQVDRVGVLLLALLVSETVAVSVSGDLNARTFFAFLALGWYATRPGGMLATKPQPGRPSEEGTPAPSRVARN